MRHVVAAQWRASTTTHTAVSVPATGMAPRRLMRWVRTRLERAGWSPSERLDVELAVCEAVQNAVEHGSAPDALIDVGLEVEPRSARIVVRDRGRPDGPAAAGPPAEPGPHEVRGRGRVIMAALADDARWEERDGGTEVRLLFTAPAEE